MAYNPADDMLCYELCFDDGQEPDSEWLPTSAVRLLDSDPLPELAHNVHPRSAVQLPDSDELPEVVLQVLMLDGSPLAELEARRSWTGAHVKALLLQDYMPKDTLLRELLRPTGTFDDGERLGDLGSGYTVTLQAVLARQSDGPLLKALRMKALDLSSSDELSCCSLTLEPVRADLHQRLLAGDLRDWKGEDQGEDLYSRDGFTRGELPRGSWVHAVLSEHGISVGIVWVARYCRSTPSKSWSYTWYVFECGWEVVRLEAYTFMKG